MRSTDSFLSVFSFLYLFVTKTKIMSLRQTGTRLAKTAISSRKPTTALSPRVFSRTKVTGTSDEQVKHFTDLAPMWWDTDGNQRSLHLMNLKRMDFLRDVLYKTVKIEDPDVFSPGYDYKQFLPRFVSDSVSEDKEIALRQLLRDKQYEVLDVGCGCGIFSEAAGRLPFVRSVLGIDLTPECVKTAQRHAAGDPMLTGKLTYELKAVEDIPRDDYDIVTCFEVLEHVDNPREVLYSSFSKLKPQGIMALSTINRDPISWFTTIFMAEDVLKVIPKGTHQLEKFVKCSEILKWLDMKYPGKYRVLGMRGLVYVPGFAWTYTNCPNVGNFFLAVQRL